MEKTDKIYVLVHPVYEKQRYARLQEHLSKIGVPMDKVVFSAASWGSELTASQIFSAWDPFSRVGLPVLTWKARCLSKGEISLVLNFVAAVRDAVEHGYKSVIIFESDVYLRSDFMSRYNDLWKDLEGKPWDYVSLGEGVGTRPPGADASYFAATKAYVPPHQFVFRCTDSMLLSGEFLKKVLHTIVPFRECLDWELNFQMSIHKGTSLWADPPLVEQGSSRNREPSLLPA
jgi:hypothetical protein